jgi:hypothetical protein
MKKYYLILGLLMLSRISSAQIIMAGESELRKLVGKTQAFNFIRDWNFTAEFRSGIGEFVKFFPLDYTNVDTKQNVKALQLDLMVKQEEGVIGYVAGLPIAKKGEIRRSVWLDATEVKLFIDFLEKNVVPNLNAEYKKKSSEYIFKSKEMVFSFFTYEKTRRITINVVDFGPTGADKAGTLIEFWTETQVDKINDLITVLKQIKL